MEESQPRFCGTVKSLHCFGFFIISLTHLNVHFQLLAIIAVSEAQERPLCGATKQPPPGICRVCLLESKLNRLWDFVSPGWLQEKPRLITI